MGMERDTVVQVLLRERLRVVAAASVIIRDVHAADDIYQQVVLAALQAGESFREPEHVLAWALRAARHRAIDAAHRRKLISLSDEVLDQFESTWSNPILMSWSDRAEALHNCLGRMAGHTRHLLNLRYVEGLSAQAIADKLRRKADAVYQTLSRAHRLLRDCVEKEVGQVSQPMERSVS